MHVRKKVTGTDIQQHDESPAHILTYLRVFIPSHCKQTLKEEERDRKRESNWSGTLHAMASTHYFDERKDILHKS